MYDARPRCQVAARTTIEDDGQPPARTATEVVESVEVLTSPLATKAEAPTPQAERPATKDVGNQPFGLEAKEPEDTVAAHARKLPDAAAMAFERS